MSLVGPRPEDPHYVELYDAEDRLVLAARPGITSLAALLYRDEERLLVGEGWERVYIEQVMPAKLAIDRAYVERQSVWLDLKILAATALGLVGLERLVNLKREVAALHQAGQDQERPGRGASPVRVPFSGVRSTMKATRARPANTAPAISVLRFIVFLGSVW